MHELIHDKVLIVTYASFFFFDLKNLMVLACIWLTTSQTYEILHTLHKHKWREGTQIRREYDSVNNIFSILQF